MAKQQHEDAPLELLASRFRVLGEPFRLRLLLALEAGEQSVGSLVETLHASQPNVSKHLQLLAGAGFVERRRVGTTILYALADTSVPKLCALALRRAARDARANWKELAAAAKLRSRK